MNAALTEVMLTGGLAPRIDSHKAAEETYTRLFPRIIAQNHKFYKRFPGDVAQVQKVVQHLSEQPGGGLRLANGDHLTPRSVHCVCASLSCVLRQCTLLRLCPVRRLHLPCSLMLHASRWQCLPRCVCFTQHGRWLRALGLPNTGTTARPEE